MRPCVYPSIFLSWDLDLHVHVYPASVHATAHPYPHVCVPARTCPSAHPFADQLPAHLPSQRTRRADRLLRIHCVCFANALRTHRTCIVESIHTWSQRRFMRYLSAPHVLHDLDMRKLCMPIFMFGVRSTYFKVYCKSCLQSRICGMLVQFEALVDFAQPKMPAHACAWTSAERSAHSHETDSHGISMDQIRTSSIAAFFPN